MATAGDHIPKASARSLYEDQVTTVKVRELNTIDQPAVKDTTPVRTRMKLTGTEEALRAMERTRLQNEAYQERFREQLRTINDPSVGVIKRH